MFKVNTGSYLELLTPEAMKLLGSTKSNIAKDKNGKYVPHLEITEVILVYCNIVNNDYKIFHPKMSYFEKMLIQNFHILKYGLLIKTPNR